MKSLLAGKKIPTVEPSVAEVQGLYGPFTFSEKLLQQIWSRRDFDTQHTATADGKIVRITHPGKWNHIGGPDFRGARLRIGDAELTGDIEVHLRETDWKAHQHASDPAYTNVVLHVVLFPSRQTTTPGAHGRAIPILTLLPLLHHDLEQYAADDAIEHLAAHALTRADKTLSALPQAELIATLARHTAQRWRQKIHFARQRIMRHGWDEACHHTALEILGYSRNRAPMLSIAEMFPLKMWQKNSAPDAFKFVDDAHARFAETGAWFSQATRPANHPRTRLRQYAEWISVCPDWPQNLLRVAEKLSVPAHENISRSVAAWRRATKAPQQRKHIRAEICGNALGGTRLDTFICDGVFPLLAAQNPAHENALEIFWTNWLVGDMPAHLTKLLRTLEVTGTRETPLHNGATQGLLGYLLEVERAEV